MTIRDSVLEGTNLAVRIKTMRGRGGGVEDVLYQNMTGDAIGGVQLTLNYHTTPGPTNDTATPVLRRITVRDLHVRTTKSFLDCEGLPESPITGIVFDNVTVTGSSSQKCSECIIAAGGGSSPAPKCTAPAPGSD